MANKETDEGDSSWALQGCLFGAVALFVILLIVLLLMSYGLFRENTQPGANDSRPISAAPAQPATGGSAHA